MAMTVAISPGKLILLLFLQNVIAEQYFNNIGLKNSAGISLQPQPKTTCGLNQNTQYPGLNNAPQHATVQQTNFQQQSNIQAPSQQSNPQSPLNFPQTNSQQSVNPMTNSQLQRQQNQNLASNIFSALYNIRQSSQNQDTNAVKGNPKPQTNYEQSYFLQPQNQPSPTCTTASIMNKPQNANKSPTVSNSFVEYSQFQPTFAFDGTPQNNVPSQQNQMFSIPVQKSYVNDQNQVTVHSEPGTNQQATKMQNAMVSGAQTTQPLVLMLQAPPEQNQPILSVSPSSQNHPIIYTVQTAPNQNQHLVSNQLQEPNNPQLDNKSLISYVMSQMQNSQGNNNIMGSILPAMLNTKSEKSSSMKALLPIIFTMLNDRKSCCGCPHCRCSNNNNQNTQEPIINSGYSNQKTYGQQKQVEEVLPKVTENIDNAQKTTSGDATKNKYNDDEVTNNNNEISEEEEEEDDTEEEYDDE